MKAIGEIIALLIMVIVIVAVAHWQNHSAHRSFLGKDVKQQERLNP